MSKYPSYTLNADKAKEADKVRLRITETGEYIGTFTRAEAIESAKGTKGIEFSFKANDGATSDFLSLWTFGADGRELYGLNILNSLMTCLKIKGIKPENSVIEKWLSTSRQVEKVDAVVFPDLQGKQIGVLLQKEHYFSDNGTPKERMVINSFFEASTGFTASEILGKANKPVDKDRRLASLKDRMPQGQTKASMTKANEPLDVAAGFDDDIDIPF